MDKKIFLLDKSDYSRDITKHLTEKALEEWVAENDYEGDSSILKIDANGYNTPSEAIENEMSFINLNDYYMVTFGF